MLGEHAIDAEIVRGGTLTVALDGAQLARLREAIAGARRHGVGEEDLRELSPARSCAERVRVAGALGASFSPHVARVHPVKLLLGLAAAVESLGVEIHERTPVTEIGPVAPSPPRGDVRRAVGRARHRGIHGQPARTAPRARADEQLDDRHRAARDRRPGSEIGWDGAETIGDGAHVYAYLQRTADGRIAIGGPRRALPLRLAHRRPRRDGGAATVASLREKLAAMFPAAAGARIEHAWSGVLGVPRDWAPAVVADTHARPRARRRLRRRGRGRREPRRPARCAT